VLSVTFSNLLDISQLPDLLGEEIPDRYSEYTTGENPDLQ